MWCRPMLECPGLAIGLVAWIGLSKVIEGGLFGVNAWDPALILAVLGATAAVATLGSVVPMIRASRVDPAIALRSE